METLMTKLSCLDRRRERGMEMAKEPYYDSRGEEEVDLHTSGIYPSISRDTTIPQRVRGRKKKRK